MFLIIKKRKKKNKAAFTLLELLVTTAIVGVIGVVVFSALSSGLKVHNRARIYGRVQSDVLLAIERLEKDIRNTFNFSSIDFRGNAKEVSFPGIINVLGEDNKFHQSPGKIIYTFDINDASLMRKEISYSSAVLETDSQLSSRRLADIEDMNLRYYYYDEENEQFSWKDSWEEDDDGIPQRVEAKITFKDDNRQVVLTDMIYSPTSTIPEKEPAT